jgi:hypothetical protein
MKKPTPKAKALELLRVHGPIDEKGRSPALGIVRKFTKPEVLDKDGNVIRKNPAAQYWQQVEREMLATVGRKYKPPKTEEQKRRLRAEKAHKAEQKRLAKRKKKKEKKHGMEQGGVRPLDPHGKGQDQKAGPGPDRAGPPN